jgi:hypothetical protein
MKYLSSSTLDPERKEQWRRAVERLYLPVLRDPGSSEDSKKRARIKLEAARRSG